MIKAEDLVQMFGNEEKEKIGKFGKIDPGYVSGRPSILLDGETIATVKKYPYLSSYVPTANDRVMIIKGVIVGKII